MKCASIVTVVALAGVFLLSQKTPTSVYGEVIEQLQEARSFRYTKRMEVAGRSTPIEVRIMVSADGRQRHEQSSGTTQILDSSPQIRLTLINRTKTAIVSEPHAFPAGRVAKHPLEWLDVLKSHGDKPNKRLDKKMLEGRPVDGFVTVQGQSTYTLWIDSQKKELVQVEHDMPVNGFLVTKVVMSDFHFHEKFDDSLFSFEVPEGYRTLTSKAIDLSQTTGGEASILEALRGYTKQSAGKFPASIAHLHDFATQISAETKDGQLDEEAKKTLAHVSGILPFLTTLSKSDYEYLGAGKTTNDERCIVFWYRDKNKKLRAIYNDLTASSIVATDLK